MAPLLLAGFGIVFLVLVVTTHGVDVVPDSVGLALYAVALWRLAGASRTLVAASTLAGVGGLVGLTLLAPGALSGAAEQARDLTFSSCVAASLGLGAWGLRRRALAGDDLAVARQLQVIALAEAVVGLALVAGYAVDSSDHDRAVSLIGAAAGVNLLVMVWYAVLLLACASRPWALPAAAPEGVHEEDRTPHR